MLKGEMGQQCMGGCGKMVNNRHGKCRECVKARCAFFSGCPNMVFKPGFKYCERHAKELVRREKTLGIEFALAGCL